MDYGRNFIQRYGCAVVGVALAVSVRLLLDPFLGFAYPFATLFVAILVAAWYGGLGPALTAVVLGGLCAIYFIIPPRGVFFPEGWYQDVGLALYTCAGIGISLLGGAVDFARRSAEAGNAEARFKSALIEQTYDSILVWDWDGRITFWNGGAERLYGFTQAEAVGRISHELLKTQFPGGFSTFYRKLEADDWWEGELVHTTKDGRVLTVESHMAFVRDASHVVEVNRDISARRRAEMALREANEDLESRINARTAELARSYESLRFSEARYRQVVDLSLECIWITSGDRIVFANRQVARLFGAENPDDLIGRQSLDFVHPDDRDRATERMQLLSRIGQTVPLEELRFVGESDRVITLEIHAVCLEYEGKPSVMAVARDVSERRSLENELRHAQKMEAIGKLTGGIAHDFNNILTVITGTIEILGGAVADKPELTPVAKLLEGAAWRAADLTQQLLAFARRQPLQPRDTDINALIVDTAKLLRSTLGEQIEIESMLRDDLRHALVDPSQLTAALINLALNSRDAMPDGGKLVIETNYVYLDEIYAKSNTEVRPGPYVLIALSDTGSGIPPAILGKVFEPFFTTKEVGRGTGLGLSMVYGFVKQSEGHIKIYSEEGHGTTIKLYLPLADQVAPLADAAPILPAQGGTESILVVEDDSLVRNFVAAQLNSLGYQVLTAGNAAEALIVIDSAAELDLLFTDVIMPGSMNGRLLADEAQRRRPSLKVLFTSGYTENAIVHHGRLDPGVLLLSKPYRKSDLARLVREAIGQPLS
jgi:PAS domain S-box-containing protein